MPGSSRTRAALARLLPDFRDYPDELEKAICGSCRTVLDVGCGAGSPIRRFAARLERTVGVDSWEPSIERSRAKGIHSEYRLMDVREVHAAFGDDAFDGVLLLDVLEHDRIPRRAPGGDSVSRLRELGFAVVGMNGWKPLRTSHGAIAWRPEPFWRHVSRLTQPLVASNPERAFQLLCVKDVGGA